MSLSVYKICLESIQPFNINKQRHLLKKIQETLYTGQWHLSPLQSRHLGTSHSCPSIMTFLRKSGALVGFESSRQQLQHDAPSPLVAKLWNEFCNDTFHAKVLCQNREHRSFWNPQISFQFSHCLSLIFVDCSPHTSNILRCSACCRPSRMWITSNRFLTIFQASVPHFYSCCTHCIIPEPSESYKYFPRRYVQA